MGGIAKKDCPYCKTKDVAFTAVEEWKNRKAEARGLFICGACHEGVIWEWWGGSQPTQVSGFVNSWGISLGRQWPEADLGDAPEDTPLTVANFFRQGTSSLDGGNFDAAGMMFRKCLESATKILDENLASKKLVKRIDELAEAGKLTTDLACWAHEVRLGGNDAAHDDEPFTLEEAQDLRNFIESFLRYAFTLPTAVKRRAKPSEPVD